MNGTVQVSFDGGETWQDVKPTPIEALTADAPAFPQENITIEREFAAESANALRETLFPKPYKPPRRERRHGEPDNRNKPHGPEPRRRKGRR